MKSHKNKNIFFLSIKPENDINANNNSVFYFIKTSEWAFEYLIKEAKKSNLFNWADKNMDENK